MNDIGTSAVKLDLESLNFTIEAISEQLKPEWIQEALQKTGKKSKRVRKLPADLVVQLVVGMGLHPFKSIANVVKDLALGFRGKLERCRKELPTSSAVTQARDRLGVEPMKLLFERQGQELKARHEAQHTYKGMRVVGVDGSTLKVADSPENRQRFGAPKSGRGRSAFPLVRIVMLLMVATHVAFAVALAPYATGELPLALTLLSRLEPGTLVLMDRGYCSYLLWCQLLQKGCSFLTRSKRRMRFRRLKKLGEGEWLVKFLVPEYLRRTHPELPGSVILRLIRYQMAGFRTSWLITSLTDPELYPRDELVSLYHFRWELELAYGAIKTRLRPAGTPLRSEEPERVLQEAYGVLIAYNVVRGMMADAAPRAKLPPLRLSFTDSLQRIQTAMIRMAAAADYLLLDLYEELMGQIAACVLPPRRHRHNPRVVKVKMSGYALKRVPRGA